MATLKSTPRRRRGALPPSAAPRIKSSANVHRLTVRTHYPASRAAFISMRRDPPPMPFLHLQGRWLDRAGFTIGTNVRVLVSPGRLILEVADAECAVEEGATVQRSLFVDSVPAAST